MVNLGHEYVILYSHSKHTGNPHKTDSFHNLSKFRIHVSVSFLIVKIKEQMSENALKALNGL